MYKNVYYLALICHLQVGRIIGKGGQNVRDLQRQTGSVIKLPQQGTTTSEETTVHILGPFFSVQVGCPRKHIRKELNLQSVTSLFFMFNYSANRI